MKKIFCTLLAVLAIGCCFAGCVNHDDDKCDECGKKETFLNPVETWVDEKEELCSQCALKKYEAELGDAIKDAIENAKKDD